MDGALSRYNARKSVKQLKKKTIIEIKTVHGHGGMEMFLNFSILALHNQFDKLPLRSNFLSTEESLGDKAENYLRQLLTSSSPTAGSISWYKVEGDILSDNTKDLVKLSKIFILSPPNTVLHHFLSLKSLVIKETMKSDLGASALAKSLIFAKSTNAKLNTLVLKVDFAFMPPFLARFAAAKKGEDLVFSKKFLIKNANKILGNLRESRIKDALVILLAKAYVHFPKLSSHFMDIGDLPPDVVPPVCMLVRRRALFAFMERFILLKVSSSRLEKLWRNLRTVASDYADYYPYYNYDYDSYDSSDSK